MISILSFVILPAAISSSPLSDFLLKIVRTLSYRPTPTISQSFRCSEFLIAFRFSKRLIIDSNRFPVMRSIA